PQPAPAGEPLVAPAMTPVADIQPDGQPATPPTPEVVSHSPDRLPALAVHTAPPAPPVVRPRQWFSAAPVSEADLPLIEARCRLKAEGARWAVTRRRRLAEGAEFRTEIDPQDRDIIAKAKELPDCFLWMNHPSGPSPANLSLLEDVAGCFEAVADAIALVRAV